MTGNLSYRFRSELSTPRSQVPLVSRQLSCLFQAGILTTTRSKFPRRLTEPVQAQAYLRNQVADRKRREAVSVTVHELVLVFGQLNPAAIRGNQSC